MKKYFGIILCFLLAIFFALDKTVLNENLKRQNVARIYVEGTLPEQNIFIEKSNVVFRDSSWCKDCKNVKTAYDTEIGHVNVKIKVKQADTLRLNLMGEHVIINDKKLPLFTDYMNLKLDGKHVFDEFKNADTTKNYYSQKIKLQPGQTFEFSVDVKKSSILTSVKYIGFDFLSFMILFAVFTFIYYAIAGFVNRYDKTQKLDAIFIVLFGFLLVVPMSHISKAEKSETENRVLATKPELFVDNGINEKYGVQFESWFNDRFNGRDWMINLFSSILYHTNTIYQNEKALFIKDNGWMFGKDNVKTPKNTKLSIDNVKKFDEFCKQHGIKLYLLLVPPKEAIYSDILGEKFGFDYVAEHAHIDYINQIQSVLPGNRVIFPYEDLKQAKEQDYVFFKQAHHWTDWGAYIGYKALSSRIAKDFKQYTTVSLSDYDKSFSTKIRDEWARDYNVGHTTNLLRLKDKAGEILNTEYTYYDSKSASDVSEVRNEYTKLFTNKNKRAKHKIFLFGNSQNEDLLQFLSHSVKNMKYLRVNMGQLSDTERFKFMKHYKKELLDYKPDIVILCFGSMHFQGFMNNFYKD